MYLTKFNNFHILMAQYTPRYVFVEIIIKMKKNILINNIGSYFIFIR